MRLSIRVGLVAMGFLLGCASTKEADTSVMAEPTDQSPLATTSSYLSTEVSDSTHPGGTWKEERDSVRKQIHLVTLAIIVAAMIVLAFTMGTAGRDG
jgi:hypothetical protein